MWIRKKYFRTIVAHSKCENRYLRKVDLRIYETSYLGQKAYNANLRIIRINQPAEKRKRSIVHGLQVRVRVNRRILTHEIRSSRRSRSLAQAAFGYSTTILPPEFTTSSISQSIHCTHTSFLAIFCLVVVIITAAINNLTK